LQREFSTVCKGNSWQFTKGIPDSLERENFKLKNGQIWKIIVKDPTPEAKHSL
jgi:hypothetical protein